MEVIPVRLAADALERLDEQWPASRGQSVIGPRAIAIVTTYLQGTYPGCEIVKGTGGADLIFLEAGSEGQTPIEVKGTRSKRLAPGQIKVSSTPSWRLLTEDKAAMYRVTDVFGPEPVIHVLRHGSDYLLKPEPRWAFVPARSRPALQQARTLAKQLKHRAVASKYDALRTWLASKPDAEVTLRFKESKKYLGFSLPASASKHQAFWANQRDTTMRPWARAWVEAGFKVDGLRLAADGWVRFRRIRRSPSSKPSPKS